MISIKPDFLAFVAAKARWWGLQDEFYGQTALS
jgi:hypothetical protein